MNSVNPCVGNRVPYYPLKFSCIKFLFWKHKSVQRTGIRRGFMITLKNRCPITYRRVNAWFTGWRGEEEDEEDGGGKVEPNTIKVHSLKYKKIAGVIWHRLYFLNVVQEINAWTWVTSCNLNHIFFPQFIILETGLFKHTKIIFDIT